MPYKPTRRQWIKLWVNEWLEGTARFQMRPEHRAIFVDLLALAGRSRTPGTILAGYENGQEIGYPARYLTNICASSAASFAKALHICEVAERIRVRHDPNGNLIIDIQNWVKYQSDYLRQRQYVSHSAVKLTPNVTTSVTPPVTLAPARDGDGEEEERRKMKKPPLAPPRGGEPAPSLLPFEPDFPQDTKSRSITDAMIADLGEHHPSVDVQRELEKFRDWCLANGRRYKNPAAAFRNWVRKAEEYHGGLQTPERSSAKVKPKSPFAFLGP